MSTQITKSKQDFSLSKIPLQSNHSSVFVVPEHQGAIFFSKWNANRRILATGGAGDSWVNVWDLSGDTVNTKPLLQLRHISQSDQIDKMPDRADANHYISSVSWSNNGQMLLTSAYDNIGRSWNMQGQIQGLIKSQNSLICSCWNKSDTLVASGGDETGVLVWDPTKIQKEALKTFKQPGIIMDIAWQNER
jgi:WD40 repeat protein